MFHKERWFVAAVVMCSTTREGSEKLRCGEVFHTDRRFKVAAIEKCSTKRKFRVAAIEK